MIEIRVFVNVPDMPEVYDRVVIKASLYEHDLPYEEEARTKIAEQTACKLAEKFHLGEPGEGWQWSHRDEG